MSAEHSRRLTDCDSGARAAATGTAAPLRSGLGSCVSKSTKYVISYRHAHTHTDVQYFWVNSAQRTERIPRILSPVDAAGQGHRGAAHVRAAARASRAITHKD